MTPSPQIRPQRYLDARQESRSSDISSSDFFDDNKMSSASYQKRKGEDSSNSSDKLSGSGSGSGAGYSADCSSSSDSSFLSSKHKTASTAIQHRVGSLTLRQNQPDDYKASNFAKNDASREPGAVSLNGKSKEKHSDAKNEQRESVRESGSNSQSQSQHWEASNENGLCRAGRPDTMHGYAVLPQWNDVRISHPMDPRIDLSTVGYTFNNAPSGSAGDMTGSASDMNYHGNHTQSLDQYLHLMDAVRPFYTGAKHNAQVLVASDGTNANSSEGFTSFFTTTHSHTNSSGSYSDTKLLDASSTQDGQAHQPADTNDHGAESDSSMIALARVKRKHQKRRHEESAEDSLSSGEGRVCHGNQDSSSAHAHKQQTSQQDVDQAPDETHQHGETAAEEQIRRDNLSSSSEDSRPNRDMGAPGHQFAVPALPIVSESSDAFARGGFSSTSNPTNTSGSGSGGNSGVSNQSSAGSGNNTGSSGSGNEGKGDNSGDGNSNSDENQASPGAKPKVDVQADDKHALGSYQPHEPRHSSSPAFLNHQPADPAHTGDHDIGREKKLIDKKRKRMNMRREYEEQVKHEIESPDNSEGNDEAVFEPGKPVTLDFALSLSKSARLIVQATLPFLVVHTNAAYTSLTEVDSHEVNGRALSSMLALPHPATRDAPQNNERQSHRAAAAAGRARAQDDSVGMNVERLVVANGFGQYHVVNVQANPEVTSSDSCCTIQCRMAVSPVVAQSPLDSSDLALVTDTNQDTAKQHHKRRKYHHDHTKPLERRHRMVITHYIIQLEKVGTTLQTSLTAGSEICQVLNKFEQSDRQMLIDHDDAFDETSQSTDAKEPVTSIG